MSIFEVRRYNGIYLIGAHYPRQIKFTIIIKYCAENRQKINRKNQSISSTGILMFIVLLKNIIFVSLPVLVLAGKHQYLRGSNFILLCIFKHVICIKRYPDLFYW